MTRDEALRIGPQRKHLRAQWRSRVASRLVADGWGRPEIAALFGVTVGHIRRYHVPRLTCHDGGKQSGAHAQRTAQAARRRIRARELLDSGLSIEEVADRVGVQPGTVEDYFKR